jgi:glutamate formiminotransferase/formiminotetrahydrofolate cyclodeaminase
VGLIPKQSLLDAADFYLHASGTKLGHPEREKIKIAVKSLGLDDLGPFDPQKKVIEYMLEEPGNERLVRMDLKRFSEETASESPAPVADPWPPMWVHWVWRSERWWPT